MNIENTPVLYSASMLITRNGYLVKVMRTVGNGRYEKICFFVDKDFNFRIWMLTERNGEPLLAEEFYRLKSSRGGSLAETSRITPEQWAKVIKLAEIVSKDPYHGMEPELKAMYMGRNTLDQYRHMLDRTYNINADGRIEFKEKAVLIHKAPVAKKKETAPAVSATKQKPAPKKAAVVVNLVPKTTKRGEKVMNDFSALASLLQAQA